MTPSQVLDAAADLIEPDGAWTQYAAARDADGRGVVATSGNACSWCPSGAILAAACSTVVAFTAHNQFVRHIGTSDIPFWNDRLGRAQGDVVAALREASRGVKP